MSIANSEYQEQGTELLLTQLLQVQGEAGCRLGPESLMDMETGLKGDGLCELLAPMQGA